MERVLTWVRIAVRVEASMVIRGGGGERKKRGQEGGVV